MIGWYGNQRLVPAKVILSLPRTTRFGFPLPSRQVLDIGYRYADLGKLGTSSGNLSDGAGNLLPTSGFTGKLRAHELLVGMRF